MSVSLIKEREEKVTVSLKKITDEDIDCIVNFIIDRSDSMRKEYRDGTVQDVLERVFPVARVLNKQSKELNLYAFHDIVIPMPSISMDNYNGYVKKYFKNIHYGCTYFVPFIELILNKYKNSKIPVFNIVVTDGEHFDTLDTRNFIKLSSNKKIFWKFIGVGGSSFTELKYLDDNLKGKVNDNVHTVTFSELPKSDSKLYDILLEQFPEFLKNFNTNTTPITNTTPNTNTTKKSWFKRFLEFLLDLFDF